MAVIYAIPTPYLPLTLPNLFLQKLKEEGHGYFGFILKLRK